ncbi:AbrB/MazE/SpoVT family DNA-binding domain-containing protein [Nitrosomonas sp.]|uniref:AbrB/MazE/SpoVT family DNA-binding domain-containing protein n=1 Tax=Nitrosomonas sp. TaxID=42353 RepID=UPI002616A334|nr:AbrB/MazE/SpoVT family DNA-binding domain-containing protein [Nitrosomonas sp.]MCW5600605.1 AbrB/MazE/SpoVT family DNA-binding domain-containing protein [Nitrosomonas sp.]
MHVTRKGQVTIPQKVRESMGIIPAETEVDFLQDEQGRWYLSKTEPGKEKVSRFRAAYQSAKLIMSTDEIMALTRD